LSEIDPTQAIKDLSISLLLDEGVSNYGAFYQRALIYHKLGYYDCAVDDYFQAVDSHPSLPLAYLNLGTIFMNHYQDYPKALEYFEKAIQHDPALVKAYLFRGDLYKLMESQAKAQLEPSGDSLDTAIRDYSKAIHLSPINHLAYLHRGKLREARCDLMVAFHLNKANQSFMQVESIAVNEKCQIHFFTRNRPFYSLKNATRTSFKNSVTFVKVSISIQTLQTTFKWEKHICICRNTVKRSVAMGKPCR
jgi:tetratricopeptide (TPR) repeat protein